MNTATKKYSQSLIAWTLVSIIAVSGVFSSGSQILCVGDEGHSKIKQAVESCCLADFSSDFDADSKGANHHDTECGDCNDIEFSNLLSTNLNKKRSPDYSPQLSTSLSALHSGDLIAIPSCGRSYLQPSLFLTISQRIVTTTVFLC